MSSYRRLPVTPDWSNASNKNTRIPLFVAFRDEQAKRERRMSPRYQSSTRELSAPKGGNLDIESSSSVYADNLFYYINGDSTKRRSRDNRRELPDGLLQVECGYRGKPCHAPRAMKIDGSLHSMCDAHRRLANENQRRADERKRKMQRDVLMHTPSRTLHVEPLDALYAPVMMPETTSHVDDVSYLFEDNAANDDAAIDLILDLVVSDSLGLAMA